MRRLLLLLMLAAPLAAFASGNGEPKKKDGV